jgi:hypothetical protein
MKTTTLICLNNPFYKGDIVLVENQKGNRKSYAKVTGSGATFNVVVELGFFLQIYYRIRYFFVNAWARLV